MDWQKTKTLLRTQSPNIF